MQHTQSKGRGVGAIILVAALGYFVDIYDLILFGIIGRESLLGIGVPQENLEANFSILHNMQMGGLLIGGMLWGILGDKRGRLTVLFGSILTYSLANMANAFVTDMYTYAVIRFLAGIGLAGELGAGITLISESMSKEKRGYGAALVATIGMLGSPAAYQVGRLEDMAHWLGLAPWQLAYLVGGAMGLVLLVLRIGVFESGMFEKTKDRAYHQGRFDMLFVKRTWRLKYLKCVALGLPTWYSIGILIFLSPQFVAAKGLDFKVDVGFAIMLCYFGLAAGDILSGLLSQVLRSRRKALGIFLVACAVADFTYLLLPSTTSADLFYVLAFCVGFGVGYWAVFVTVASEQFGTNIRATVTTTVPNFARGALIPITLAYYGLQGLGFSVAGAAATVGVICMLLAGWATWSMPETHGKDLDYIEE
ncbi:MAG: MFS transporter [Bacteroidetes bacterium]|nr:MFS transporter [Bacteroidota bacterium]